MREASFKQLKENREIQNILRILGLQINDKVQDTRGLRYGSLMIMTDQVSILLFLVQNETCVFDIVLHVRGISVGKAFWRALRAGLRWIAH